MKKSGSDHPSGTFWELKSAGSSVGLLNDDNFEWCSNESVDLILTDPPFNIARDTNFHTYEKNTINSYRFDKDKGWDTYSPSEFRGLLRSWAAEFERVLRPGGNFAVFCSDDYLSELIWSLREVGLKPRRTITWRKPNAVPVNRSHMMMSACEYIVYGVKRANATFNVDIAKSDSPFIDTVESNFLADKAASIVSTTVRDHLSGTQRPSSEEELARVVEGAIAAASREVSRRVKSLYARGEWIGLSIPNYLSFNSKGGKRLHPTEKPIDLLSYLIHLLSMPGDKILDPFAGSGSTGEAAMTSGRSCTLVEADPEFYGKAVARLDAVAQSLEESLF
jgi:DNA modification methylase